MSETLIQSIRDEFQQFSLYKEQYDYLCGSPLVKKLIEEISILEKQNRKMMTFVLENKNEKCSEIQPRKQCSKLNPLRKKSAKSKKHCETQTQTHAELSNITEHLNHPLVYIKEEPKTAVLPPISKFKRSEKSAFVPIVIVDDTEKQTHVFKKNDMINVKNNIFQEQIPTEEQTEDATEEEAIEETAEELAEETTEELAEETAEEQTEDATEEETVEETTEELAEETTEEEAVEETIEELAEETTEEQTEETTEEEAVEETIEEEAVEETAEELAEETTEEKAVEETTDEDAVEETTEEEEGEEVFAVVINGIEYYTTDETNGVIFNEDLSVEIGKFENKVAKFYK